MDDLKVHMGQLKMKTNVAKKVQEVKEEFAREEEERSRELADSNLFEAFAEGALDLGRLKFGLYKSRAVVIFAWFWFGKGNFVWILVIARTLADLRPDLFAALNPATEEGKVLWKAFAIL